MSLSGMRAVVTGGAGFIGSHLVRALAAANARVQVFDDLSSGSPANLPSGTVLTRGDVRDTERVRDAVAGADLVFHLAAVSSVARCQQDLHEAHTVNLGGVVSVVEAVRDAAPAAPLLFASSAAVYGVPDALPIAESAPARPRSFYGLDKLGGERVLAMASAAYGLRVAALRVFNAYGTRQDASSPYSGVISLFASRLRAGQPVTIFGDGEQTRDFIRAEDVAAHFVAGAVHLRDRPAGTSELVNVCTGTGTRIREVFDRVAALVGSAAEPDYRPARDEDIRQSVGDPTHAAALLGIPTAAAFPAGLTEFLQAADA